MEMHLRFCVAIAKQKKSVPKPDLALEYIASKFRLPLHHN